MVFYGYQFEDPTKIYAIDFTEFKLGAPIPIKKYSETGFKSYTDTVINSQSHLKSERVKDCFRSENGDKQLLNEQDKSPAKSTKNNFKDD